MSKSLLLTNLVIFALLLHLCKGSLLATTFTSKQNDTIALLSTQTGRAIRSSNSMGSYVEIYDNAAYDPLSHMAMLYGISDGMNTLDFYNVDTLQMERQIVLEGNNAPVDIQYDMTYPGQLLAISGIGPAFAIVFYDLKSGNKSEIMPLKDVVEMSESTQAYDTKNHRYYTAVSMSNNGPITYNVYNIKTRTLERNITVPTSLDNTQFDRFGNRLVGLVNDVYCYVDLESGQFVKTGVDLSNVGFRQLGASAIDTNYYYVFYENHSAQSFFVKIDLKTLAVRVEQVYDLIGTLLFVPGK